MYLNIYGQQSVVYPNIGKLSGTCVCEKMTTVFFFSFLIQSGFSEANS